MHTDKVNIKSKEFWNNYCKNFSAIYGTNNSIFNNIVNTLFRRGMKQRYLATIKQIPIDSSGVLDMGCGPGVYLRALAEKNIKPLTGVDFSDEMLQIAKSATDEFGGKVELIASDIFKFKPKSRMNFDDIIMMGFIEYFTEPTKVMQAMANFNPERIFVSFPMSGGILAWQRKKRYQSRCFLKLYTKKEILEVSRNLTDYDCEIKTMSRDYFVKYTRKQVQ